MRNGGKSGKMWEIGGSFTKDDDEKQGVSCIGGGGESRESRDVRGGGAESGIPEIGHSFATSGVGGKTVAGPYCGIGTFGQKRP